MKSPLAVIRQTAARVRAVFRRGAAERDMAAEMAAHLDLQAEEYRNRGMDAEEARYAARRQFGNVASVQERCRAQRGAVWIELFLRDLRFAARALAKHRGATVLAVLSIALGIGLTTALFGVADALIFRPYAFARPEEVFAVNSRGDDQRIIGYGWRDVEDMTREAAGAGDIVGYQRVMSILATDGEGELVSTHIVTPNFFAMLGVRAALGQASLAAADAGRPNVVVGHGLWRRRFGGDPAIVGKTIVLNSRPFTVAGVMPPTFKGLFNAIPCDVWTSTDSWPNGRRERAARDDQYEIVVRLPAGTVPAGFAARLDAAIRGPAAHKPAPAGAAGTWLGPFARTWQQKAFASGGLLPVFGLLLLVACANAAQLRLAQAEARKKEMGVRLALGSSLWGLARLQIIETLLVSAAGAAGGLLVAREALDRLSAAVRSIVGLDFGLALDWRAGAFALAATACASLLAGIAPVRHALRLEVLDTLKSEEGTVRMKNRMQRLLLVGQTAASVVFFGLALLFLASFRHAAAIWPGFDPGKSIVVIPVVNQGLRLPRPVWLEQAAERLRTVPGVRDATYARRLPLSGNGGGLRLRVEVAGQAPLAVGANMVGPNYFPVMGTKVLAGRPLGADDRANSTPAVVLSALLARQAFGERNPIGESVTIEGHLWQVVGVVEDAPAVNLHEDLQPLAYLPYAQLANGDVTLIVDTAVAAGALVRPLQEELKRFDPDVVTFGATTLRQHVDRALFPDRLAANGATGLGVLGFLLTAAGLFGMVQFSVNRRTREIGVRMALGAGPDAIRRSILGESLRIVGPGIVAGLLLLAGVAWGVRSLFLDVNPLDPRAYGLCAVMAAAVSVLAAWLPARRATRINPVEALRAE